LIASNDHADIDRVTMLPEGGGPLAAFCESAFPLWIGVGAHREPIAWLQKQLGSALELLSVTADASRCLVARRQPELPPAYFVAELRARLLHGPLVAQPELRSYPLAEMSPRVARSSDDLSLVSYLTAPAGACPAAGWPTVLWVHGGPWRRDSWQFDARHQWLASRGYAVLSVNFRGSTGLGKAFINAADGEWGGKMHDDLLDSLDAWAAEGWIDPARVAIVEPRHLAGAEAGVLGRHLAGLREAWASRRRARAPG
jgi:dipeptidyl aminopeptidase/acylaminoacyl peptidase